MRQREALIIAYDTASKILGESSFCISDAINALRNEKNEEYLFALKELKKFSTSSFTCEKDIKMLKVIIIDPFSQSIYEKIVCNNLKNIDENIDYSLSNRYFLKNKDCCHYDINGAQTNPTHFFIIENKIFYGKAIVLGLNDFLHYIPPIFQIKQLRKEVIFPKFKYYSWAEKFFSMNKIDLDIPVENCKYTTREILRIASLMPEELQKKIKRQFQNYNNSYEGIIKTIQFFDSQI